MVKAKLIKKAKEFEGFPKLSDFSIVDENIDENLKEGEILTEALAVSVDPFLRAYPIPVDSPMIGFQVAKVIKSNCSKYPTGSRVLQTAGWRTVSKTSGDTIWYSVDQILTPEMPISYAVGVLGMPGMTAYCGFMKICLPKAGETVMVNGCAGAVGSLVGQIAKIKGCTVIGCCGTDEKCKWVKSLGFDHVFNYKTVSSYKEEIAKLAPKGIDCFFENVGGQMSTVILNAMNIGGRIAVCGSISSYNEANPMKADIIQPAMVYHRLRMRGFNVNEFKDDFPEALKNMTQWLKEGKLQARETVFEGFDNLPKAFIDMLGGGNIGKAVVRL